MDIANHHAISAAGTHEAHEGSSPRETCPAWNTPEALDLMRRLWAAGKSASEIGNLLGVTKNAILGKIHRLGLHRNARKTPRELRQPRPRTTSVVTKTAAVKKRIAESKTPGLGAPTNAQDRHGQESVPLYRVRPLTCRWPLWSDDAKPDHTYCDKPAVAAWPGVYCVECRIKAFARTATPSNTPIETFEGRTEDRSAA